MITNRIVTSGFGEVGDNTNRIVTMGFGEAAAVVAAVLSASASSKIVNIKRSLDYYVKTNLETTEGLNVDYEGLPFDDTAVSEYIRPRIIEIESPYLGLSSSTKYGEDIKIIFQIGIFVKKTSLQKSDRDMAIRDIVANYFKVGQDITIYDWYSTGLSITNARVREIFADYATETGDLLLSNISFELSHVLETTVP